MGTNSDTPRNNYFHDLKRDADIIAFKKRRLNNSEIIAKEYASSKYYRKQDEDWRKSMKHDTSDDVHTSKNTKTDVERSNSKTSVRLIEKKENSSTTNQQESNIANTKWLHPRPQDYRYSVVDAVSALETQSYFKGGFDVSISPAKDMIHKKFNASSILISSDDQDQARKNESQKQEIIYRVKTKVDNAIKKHQIFAIRGELPKLKAVLEDRGWIQKFENVRTRFNSYGNVANDPKLEDLVRADGTMSERALIYTMLRQTPPDLVWDCRNDFVEWDINLSNNVWLNKFQKSSVYTSKLGMAFVLQESHWLCEDDISYVKFPRSYNPSREMSAFVQDFHRTGATGLLRWFVDHFKKAIIPKFSGEFPVPVHHLEFAVKRCAEYVADLLHESIDCDDCSVTEEEWKLFFHEGVSILYTPNASMHKCDLERLQACYLAAQSVLKKLKGVDPQYELNGDRNMWILKPSNLCCGSGIFLTHDLNTIIRKVDNKTKDYYIIQKYIERPLLVENTKFDIRQWFLVTNSFPLTIWLFKESLLRFSSKPYSFSTYHEAIHICNTAVQEKYDYERRRKNRQTEDNTESLRDQEWDCKKLNDYLKKMGHGTEPYETIYQKMSQAIVLTMLASQDYMDRRRYTFELYGADFVVMDDMSVWLIEINTNPRMHPPSSKITQRLYDAVLEDLMKVVMDLPNNPETDTGGFELVYKQANAEIQPYLGPCFFALGKSLTLHESSPKKKVTRKKISDTWSKEYQRTWIPPAFPKTLPHRKIDDMFNNRIKVQTITN